MLKKLLLILLVHVIVLGSLWIWRENRDHDSCITQDKYLPGDAVTLVIKKADSSGMEMILCINPDKLTEATIKQPIDVSVLAHAAIESKSGKLNNSETHTCYQINTSQSDCECVPAGSSF